MKSMNCDYELVIPSRGGEALGMSLSGLIPHAAQRPFPLRLVLSYLTLSDLAVMALETLRHLGCEVTVEAVRRIGLSQARWQAARNSPYDVLVMLDDDAVLSPVNGIPLLAGAATQNNWVNPIIRYTSNFLHPDDLPGHTELWETVSTDDPRVRTAVAARGKGWIRVFDTGVNHEVDQMGGTCFAVQREKLIAATETMNEWRWGWGEDLYMGKLLGKGLVLSSVYAYHYGRFSYGKWAVGDLTERMVSADPSFYDNVNRKG